MFQVETFQLINFDRPLTSEEKILTACKSPQAIDALIEQTGKSLDDIQFLLFELQLQGKISQDISGSWRSSNLFLG